MIAIILAGGYAKRLWPLTANKPKALLPISGKPIVNYVIEKITPLDPPVSRIILSTNLRFQSQFKKWLKNTEYCHVELMPERSSKEEEKLGAVRALADIVEKIGEEDVLVLAGDNLFNDNLGNFLSFFRKKHAPTIALYYAGSVAEAKRGSTVVTGESGQIIEFVEKPMHPKATLVGACVYAFPARIGKRLKEYLQLGLAADEPGRFIQWLHKQEPVYGYMLKDYLWDIGTIESYKAADKFFSQTVENQITRGDNN
ncbi:MAG TPA: nucleotidyltransferase family protein [Candidatus Bathyarchaeia archaeon]|nr:nucleotidyltransferase family protein [Candidatus Bathyarchaeia archaeon]